MHQYGVRDVERLLGLPPATLRAMVAAGFVTPERGVGNRWRFSFQDLIVLRTAQSLANADVPQRRISNSLRELRRQLPDSMPLSGLSIGAVGDRVVVREAGTRWQAESGQYLLEFDGDPDQGALSVIERREDEPAAKDSPAWFEHAAALEGAGDAAGAMRAYGHAVAADPSRIDARINLGNLMHAAGQLDEAERTYRDALDICGGDAVLLFNLGVLLEDMRRPLEAVQAYRAALRADAELADAHYNVALLYRRLGRPREAIRHMGQYRRLITARAT
jgi:tetratricopeptide (TPR) repeat protein